MNVMMGSSLLLNSAGYQISRSVRLRSSASAYFNRTPASAGNRKTWTWSGWVKLGSLSTTLNLMYAYSADSDSGLCQLSFQSNQLRIQGFSASFLMVSTPVYRDPSAWYHIVYKVDTTQATAANRVRVYVNGVEITAWATNTPPPQNTDTAVNNNVAHNIGRNTRNSNDYLDGYLTEINLIDGQALDPSYFGETNAVTGVWQPKKYAGTYGTNGFYLNFSDNSAATATTIGKDYSGNGNNWTPNNISVTAGVTYDSMIDVPTPWADGGNGRGNYCTLNRLAEYGTIGQMGCNNGNLVSSPGGSAINKGFLVTTGIDVGMTAYAEATFTTTAADNNGGVAVTPQGNANPGDTATSMRWMDGAVIRTNNVGTSYGSTLTANDVVMMAVNYESATSCKIWIGKNGTWFASGNPATGANPSVTLNPAAVTMFIASYHFGNGAVSNWTFGQRPFAYTPPTGFKALNTLNLPTPTILKGNQYFDATTYSGQNTSLSVTNSGSMQPDLVWIKKRSGATDHNLTDAVRGTNKNLISNSTAAEDTTARLTSFDSNGFTLAGAFDNTNLSGSTYVGWQWKEGATQGFDIVTYTGNGANRTIAHNLGVAPSMIIVKARNLPNSIARSWAVWHSALSATEVIFLNQTSAKQTGATTYWNSTLPTSSVFSLGTEPTVNGAIGTVGEYVAYLFAAVAGYSAFGSYTGNGSADGPFVFLGFRPRWILTKAASGATGSWWLYDTVRSTYNEMTDLLRPDLNNADTTQGFCDATANGFKIRNSGNNTNGATYIFAAFAENPFKYALAR